MINEDSGLEDDINDIMINEDSGPEDDIDDIMKMILMILC